jgi:hypothetical protein
MDVGPYHVAVLALATREVEARPSFNLVHVRNLLVAVVLVDLRRHELLGVVCDRLVIQDADDVCDDPIVLERLDIVDEFLLCQYQEDERARKGGRQDENALVPHFVRTVPFWSNSPRSRRS